MTQESRKHPLRFVFVSDTHGRHTFDVPEGDVLVHAGDFTMRGLGPEIAKFNDWLKRQPHRYKVVIAGNHDLAFEDAPDLALRLLDEPIYLCDSDIVIEGVRIYGSPYQPWFYDWAFNFPQGPAGRVAARETWAKIPDGIDVLVTHGPPRGILDLAPIGGHVGCEDLLARVQAVKPKVHAFGHIHGAAGVERHGQTLFVNACICDESYLPTQRAVVVDVFDGRAVLGEDAEGER